MGPVERVCTAKPQEAPLALGLALDLALALALALALDLALDLALVLALDLALDLALARALRPSAGLAAWTGTRNTVARSGSGNCAVVLAAVHPLRCTKRAGGAR